MINAILTGIFKLIIGLVSLILAPIDGLILAALPDLSQALSAVGAMFNYAGQFIGFAVSLTGLSQTTITVLIMYFTFKLTAPIGFYMLKLAIKWYDKLKP